MWTANSTDPSGLVVGPASANDTGANDNRLVAAATAPNTEADQVPIPSDSTMTDEMTDDSTRTTPNDVNPHNATATDALDDNRTDSLDDNRDE